MWASSWAIEFDHGRVQLVLVALRRGAAFEVADLAAGLGDDQRALELAGVARVDAEVRRQLHRAAHAGRDVDERAVGEHGRVQRRVEVVARRHHAAEVALDQLGVVLHRVRERTEDHADLGELLAEGGAHRDRVEHRVDRHAGKPGPLVQRHAQLLVGLEQLGVDVGQALRTVLRGVQRLGRRVVAQGLEVDRRDAQVAPAGVRHRRPALEGGQAPLEQELGLALAARDRPHRVGVQARRQGVALDVGDEAMPIGQLQGADQRCGLFSDGHGPSPR